VKRVLVTGGSGFIASSLIPYLHQKGFQIWASYHTRARKFPFPVHWAKTDLTRIQETLKLVREARPHFIFHLAGQARPAASWDRPDSTLKLNVIGSLFLLEGMVKHAPRARAVFLSSAQVYGMTFFKKKRVREEDPAVPASPYAGSKLLMEMAALNFVKRHNLWVVIARAFNHVGTGQSGGFVFSDFCRQIALMEKGKKPPVLNAGNIDVVRDFIPLADAVRAYLLLAQRGQRGGIYNVGTGRGTLIRDALRLLAGESRVPFRIRRIFSRVPKMDFPQAVGDPSKLKRLGWHPREPLKNTLRELLSDWREKVI